MTSIDAALFEEFADGVVRAGLAALAKAFACLGGTAPRFHLWERVDDLRRVLDAGRAYFTPAEFLARFRGTRTAAFDLATQPGVQDCVGLLVELAMVEAGDRGGEKAAAALARLKGLLPAALAEADAAGAEGG